MALIGNTHNGGMLFYNLIMQEFYLSRKFTQYLPKPKNSGFAFASKKIQVKTHYADK